VNEKFLALTLNSLANLEVKAREKSQGSFNSYLCQHQKSQSVPLFFPPQRGGVKQKKKQQAGLSYLRAAVRSSSKAAAVSPAKRIRSSTVAPQLCWLG
jgi:hypothetical protein